jgi:hypothetical protein
MVPKWCFANGECFMANPGGIRIKRADGIKTTQSGHSQLFNLLSDCPVYIRLPGKIQALFLAGRHSRRVQVQDSQVHGEHLL